MIVRTIFRPVVTGLAILASSALAGGDAGATPCTDNCSVSNGNASIRYDAVDDLLGDGLMSGLEDWTISGVPQLFQQVFAIRIGANNTINVGNLTLGSADADDANDTISVAYSTGGGDDTVSIDLVLALGTGASEIAVSVDITAGANLFGTPISFFMYTDLDVAGTFLGDTGSSTSDTLIQSDGKTTLRVRTATPTSGFEVANDFPFLFNAIESGTLGGAIQLNGATGPLSGDVNHAFQWTYTPSAENRSFAIEAANEVLPAPAPLGLLGIGMIGLGLARRMKRA